MAMLAGLLGAMGGKAKIFDTIENAVGRVAKGIKEKKRFGQILKDVGKGAVKDIVNPQTMENLKDFAASEVNKKVDKVLTGLAPTVADKRPVISPAGMLGDKVLDLDEAVQVDPEEKDIEETIEEVKKVHKKNGKKKKKKVKLKAKPKKEKVEVKEVKKIKVKKAKKPRSAAQVEADKKKMAKLRAMRKKAVAKKKFKAEL